MSATCSPRRPSTLALPTLLISVALVLMTAACGDDGSAVASPLATTGTSSSQPTTSAPTEPDWQPEGSWRAVQDGTTDGVRWTLYAVPAQNDGLCISVDLEPLPIPAPSVPLSADAYEGREPSCFPRNSTRDPRVPPVWLATKFLAGDGGYVYLSGVVRPDVRALDVVTPTNPVQVPVVDGTFIWIAPAGSSVPTSLDDAGGAFKCPVRSDHDFVRVDC